MPAIAHQNKILGNTSGGGSTILVTTSESSLYGQTITLSDGTTTLSGTFSNTGECEFAGVMMTGTLTLACGGVSQSISVPYFGNYSFVFSLFSATVNVTYPYTEGATCTLSDGTTTLIATGSPMAFTVPNAGAWTASVELDGNTKTTTTYITTDGQVASINIVFGTINVTYENDFKGVSITCTLGATTITKTAPTTGNTMSFYPPTTGQWTISGTVGGVPYPTTANVTSLSTPVSVNLETIPNGSTATPTDDIQIWLKCAGITDKSYTTLNEVLADSETYNALLGDSNACAYMKRSTTWTTDLCADQYAMNMIGQYDVCCDALLSDATWTTALNNSSYWYGHTDSGVLIHGGNPTYDSFYRIVDGNNVPVTDPSLLDAGTYTIYSNGLAKDPDNLSNDYGKTVRICPNTKEIVVRPDNSLYWYGYEGARMTAQPYNNGTGTAFAPSVTKNQASISLTEVYSSQGNRRGAYFSDNAFDFKTGQKVKLMLSSYTYGDDGTYEMVTFGTADQNANAYGWNVYSNIPKTTPDFSNSPHYFETPAYATDATKYVLISLMSRTKNTVLGMDALWYE